VQVDLNNNEYSIPDLLLHKKQSINLGRIGLSSSLYPPRLITPILLNDVTQAFITAQQMLESMNSKTYKQPFYLKVFDVVGGVRPAIVKQFISDINKKLGSFKYKIKNIRNYEIVIREKRWCDDYY
jgi:hypothetical protein